MIKLLRSHLLLLYFILAFLLSWSIWVPMALDHYGLLPFKLDEGFVMIVRLFGTLGPAAAAILVSLLAGGGAAVKALFGHLGQRRVKWTWYAAACLVYPALLFVAAWIYQLLPGMAPLPFQPVSTGNLIIIIVVMTISVLGEETGWRGFALPRMQAGSTALKASLVLGTIHTIWHLPFWIVLGELERFGWIYWVLNWAFILALTIYMTWIMNNTRNSLLLAVLLHWTFNIVSAGFLPLTSVIPAYAIFIILSWAVALGLLSLYGSKQLVKQEAG